MDVWQHSGVGSGRYPCYTIGTRVRMGDQAYFAMLIKMQLRYLTSRACNDANGASERRDVLCQRPYLLNTTRMRIAH
jgi:hypothetical protein